MANCALLLVRHPSAAAFARRWNAKEETWQLSAPAEPLNLVVEARSGQRVIGAHLVVWIDGVRLSGLPLTFLTGTVPATNASGTWTGRNLPAKPLRVLALPRNAGASIASPAFDVVAADVAYPWPPSVTTLVAQ